MAWNLQKIPIEQDVYIDPAVTSHDIGGQCKAEFSNVTVVGVVSGVYALSFVFC
ncbi:MAG: hypothetical protein PVH77_02265 [Phycisphaerales bacterium]|jgi:hypothetical protein